MGTGINKKVVMYMIIVNTLEYTKGRLIQRLPNLWSNLGLGKSFDASCHAV